MTMDIAAYCLSRYKACVTTPFGPCPICYKVSGKIFAQLYPDKLTLKCTRFQGELFRSTWPGIVTRGYHCPPVQQPYWNTIDLSRFPENKLPNMIDLAYNTVVSSLSKKEKSELLDPIGKSVNVIIDRPLGSLHPKHPDIQYPINYGYIPGIFAGDGEEQDAYILGVDVPLQSFTGKVIAIIHRTNDAEDKWVVAPPERSFTPEQIHSAVAFQEQYFDSQLLT